MAASVQPVTWYDSAIPSSRRSSVQWWPNAGEVDEAGDELGRVFASSRPTPADVWPPARELAGAVTRDAAVAIAIERGCPFRVFEAGS